MIKEVRDHWYWRPNWRPGRSFYTWHIVFPNDPVLAELHTAYQGLITSLPGISPVPLQWLHLTLQGVGFSDKVPQEDLEPIVEAAQRRLEHFRPFEIRLGPAVVDVESLQLPVSPVDRLRRLRAQLRAAVTDVWGRDSVPELPELHPHVSLGYWNRPAPAEPLRQRVNALAGGTATTEVTHVTLLNLNRDHAQYEWTTHATLPLGEPPPNARSRAPGSPPGGATTPTPPRRPSRPPIDTTPTDPRRSRSSTRPATDRLDARAPGRPPPTRGIPPPPGSPGASPGSADAPTTPSRPARPARPATPTDGMTAPPGRSGAPPGGGETPRACKRTDVAEGRRSSTRPATGGGTRTCGIGADSHENSDSGTAGR